MKINELFEQTFAPAPPGQGGALPPTTTSAGGTTTPGMTGNVAQLTDPRLQAAQLAKVKQDKAAQQKTIQSQISALQKQLSALQSSNSTAPMMGVAPTV